MAKKEYPSFDEIPEFMMEDVEPSDRAGFDFKDLRRILLRRAEGVERIALPSEPEWDGLIARSALNAPLQNQYFWDLHSFARSTEIKEQISLVNAEFEELGIEGLQRGKNNAPPGSAVEIILSAIDSGVFSFGLLHAWARVHAFFERHTTAERWSLPDGDLKAIQRAINAGSAITTLPQKIWFARWIENSSNMVKREAAEEALIDLCAAVVKGKRRSPDERRWPREWFRKLLAANTAGGKILASGTASPELTSAISRLTPSQLKVLADNPLVSNELLPPYDEAAFPLR